MKTIKVIVILIKLFIVGGYCQSGSVYETYKQPNWQGDSNASTIFPKTFQEFNYIKTSRGIEVYKTYSHTNPYTYTTNRYYQAQSTIFSKPLPDFIIKNNGTIYKTYSYGTNRGSIFTKPFESKRITKPTRADISFDGETINNSLESTGSEE
jgi:hypothetical protein